MQAYIENVTKNRELIANAFEYIWANPETGYKEWKTHNYLKEQFLKLGYTLTEAGNIPGFTAEIDTGKKGPTIAIFGELDAIIVPDHPDADKETGAVHACGHATQTAALVGIAAALKEKGALDGLCGKVRLIAVPAEEGIELEFREDLKKQGVIHSRSGKIEFLHRGLLDGIDMSFMVHADVEPAHTGSMNGGSNGLISKTVTFGGVSAHAGGSPHKGVNALYAANLALSAINALRETFVDNKHIRVHPIITDGGASVNVIPNKVKMETYVRGADMDAIIEANKKVNRAIAASAAAIGCTVHINDDAGSWPRLTDNNMAKVFVDAMNMVYESVDYGPNRWNAGCSDMGDIGSLMPTVHAYAGGATGEEHGNNYRIESVESACVESAIVQFLALRLFLENNAEKALKAINSYNPYFKNKDEYFAFKNSITREFDAVSYDNSGKITLNL